MSITRRSERTGKAYDVGSVVDRLPDQLWQIDPANVWEYLAELTGWLHDDQQVPPGRRLSPDLGDVLDAIGFDPTTVFRAWMTAR